MAIGTQPFSFTTNLAGARAYLTSEGDIPTGAWVGVITGWEFPVETKAKDASMLVLECTVQDGKLADVPENQGKSVGEFKGRTKRIYMVIPETCQDPKKVIHAQGNVKGWLMAMGYDEAAINTGAVPLDHNTFYGKPVVFWNVGYNERQEGQMSAVTPGQYQKAVSGTWHGPLRGEARKDAKGGEGAATLMPSAAQSVNPMQTLGLAPGGQAQVAQAPVHIPASTQAAPGLAPTTFAVPGQVVPGALPSNGMAPTGGLQAGAGMAAILQHNAGR